MIGNRELDPVNVGFVSIASERFMAKNTSSFDTTLLGNSNSGHEYGVELLDGEKKALIEYMKTL